MRLAMQHFPCSDVIYRTTLKTPLLISAPTGNAIIVGINVTNCYEANTCGEMLIVYVLSSQFAKSLHIPNGHQTSDQVHMSRHQSPTLIGAPIGSEGTNLLVLFSFTSLHQRV